MSTYTREEARPTAEAARRQIGWQGLATLGASDLAVVRDPMPGLTFLARIHPFTKTGKRAGRARVMRVFVTINHLDLWDVKVELDGEEHYAVTDVYAGDLQKLMVALDYDGPEVVNPRYWT